MNLYGFGRNNPVFGWDQLGRAWGPDDVIVNSDLIAEQGAREAADRERDREESLKRIAELHQVPENYKNKCAECTQELINKGEHELKSHYNNFATAKPETVPEQGSEGVSLPFIGKAGSCHDVNIELLVHFQNKGIPKCWTCRLVHFSYFSIRIGKDHWWVECAAYNDNGATVNVIAFDWWRNGAKPGEDPAINRARFPYLNLVDTAEQPQIGW